MMEMKKFMDLAVGSRFKNNAVEYEKINEERISCCQVLNAQTVNDPKQKIQILPLTEVEVL